MNVHDCKLGNFSPSFIDISKVDQIREEYKKNGLVFIENTDEKSLVELSAKLGRIVKPRNEVGDGSGVSNIRCAPGLVGKGYSSEELFFHTDRSGWDLPPQLLLTALKLKSSIGGESLFVDTRRLRNHLKAHDPSLYSLLTNAKYSSFRNDDGSFKPRPIFDEVSGIFRIRYDDGIQFSPSLIDCLPEFKRAVFDHAFSVSLEPGQSYIADNHRYLHGRTSFEGSRELLRVLAHPHTPIHSKLILFDVDGTLCRSEALSIDAYYRCISDILGRSITHENTKVNLHGQTDLGLLRDILEYHHVDAVLQEDVIRQFFEMHPKYLEESLAQGLTSTPCPGAADALQWLAARQKRASDFVTVGLLTGNSRRNALLKIRAAGLDTEMFNLEVSAFGDSHPTRPSLVASAIKSFAEHYGVTLDGERVLLVGDTPLDIQCAKHAGCQVLAVTTGNYTKQDLQPLDADIHRVSNVAHQRYL